MELLAQQKLEAEIANLKALAAKAEAETRRMEDEGKPKRRSVGQWMTDNFKTWGALVVGMVGAWSALLSGFNGAQLSEIRKERMDFAVQKMTDDLKQKTDQLAEASRRKLDMDAAVKENQQQMDKLRQEIDTASTELSASKSAEVNVEWRALKKS